MIMNQWIHCTYSHTCILLHSNWFYFMFLKCHKTTIHTGILDECDCLNESNCIIYRSQCCHTCHFYFLDSIIFKSYFMILIDNQNTCILLCTGWYQVSLGLPGIASFLSHCIKRFENLIFFCHDSIYSTSYIATAIREFFEWLLYKHNYYWRFLFLWFIY